MGAGDKAGWWRGCVIYQIYPRSFQDTTGHGSGDLSGVTSRLAHVASLGVFHLQLWWLKYCNQFLVGYQIGSTPNEVIYVKSFSTPDLCHGRI